MEYMLSSVIVYTLLVHASFGQSTGIYNIINKESDSFALLMYFVLTWSSLKNVKTSSKVQFCTNTLFKYNYLIKLKITENLEKDIL